MRKKKKGKHLAPRDSDLMTDILDVICKTGVARGPNKVPEPVLHFGGNAHLTPTREECGL